MALKFKCKVSQSALLIGRRHILLSQDCVVYPKAVLCAGYLEYKDFSPPNVIEGYGAGSITVGSRTVIHTNAILATYGGSIKIGENVSINPFSVLYGHGGLTIGNNTRIATGVTIIPVNHVFNDCENPIYQQGLSQLGITIADDVWIGANCCILDGITVGTGAVIGAGSVVTKSIPSNEVWAGNPAKHLKYR
jgi:acetyltransferase-like isoleucine patch superfamily enzyme